MSGKISKQFPQSKSQSTRSAKKVAGAGAKLSRAGSGLQASTGSPQRLASNTQGFCYLRTCGVHFTELWQKESCSLFRTEPSPVTAGSQPSSSVEDAEQILRTFDLTSKFGPCVGISRLDRYILAVPAADQCCRPAAWLCCGVTSMQPQVSDCPTHFQGTASILIRCIVSQQLLSKSITASRWERSQRFGLNPPAEVKALLEQGSQNASVWAGEV